MLAVDEIIFDACRFGLTAFGVAEIPSSMSGTYTMTSIVPCTTAVNMYAFHRGRSYVLCF